MWIVFDLKGKLNWKHIKKKYTTAFVGSMIRCFRRLEELMRQMVQAAKAIGNTELENKFSEGKANCYYSTYFFFPISCS